ncbi:MAG: hypothetical protein HY976_02385 [Candidatus Kerfeldbacteria bacterium]|nr:hypothetical protein [Candidatus Kerfeldbacteria bacterium]
MMRYVSLVVVLPALLLLGWSCKNKFAAVNVNVNATAQAVVNVSKTVNAADVSRESAVAQAKALYIAEEAKGRDFSNGPCLSNNLIGDWVADIAHNPRTSIDDRPENQCSAYRDGTAKHFVELDLDGQLIRAE